MTPKEADGEAHIHNIISYVYDRGFEGVLLAHDRATGAELDEASKCHYEDNYS